MTDRERLEMLKNSVAFWSFALKEEKRLHFAGYGNTPAITLFKNDLELIDFSLSLASRFIELEEGLRNGKYLRELIDFQNKIEKDFIVAKGSKRAKLWTAKDFEEEKNAFDWLLAKLEKEEK